MTLRSTGAGKQHQTSTSIGSSGGGCTGSASNGVNNTSHYLTNATFLNQNYNHDSGGGGGGGGGGGNTQKGTQLASVIGHHRHTHQQPSKQSKHKSHNNEKMAYSHSANNGNGSSTTVLGEISNLTTEEKKKLEEIRNRRSKLIHEIQKLKEEISVVKKEMNRLDHNLVDSGTNLGSGGSSNDGSAVQRAKQLSIGKKKFNMDPKKGIEFLVSNNLLNNTPEEVAKFLYKGEGLNKTAIGTYLGDKIDFNLQVLDSFIELHDFKNLLLVQALRQFLWSFRLPGEAQKIDRMMEKFAARYCQQNPGVFSNTDTCFVLSFSIIMLNTSLHNPNVKEKMTADRFVVMNRGINNGCDLPRELLISLYESIRQEPFKIPEDDGNDLMHTFFNPDREGWLWKQGGRYKSWKRRWFILNDKCLYYFEYTTDKEPRGIIPLENVDIREISDRGGRQNCFELYSTISDVIKACKTDTEGRVIEGRHSVYRLSAATVEDKDAWVDCIRASVSRNPFYEMLAARKRKAQQN